MSNFQVVRQGAVERWTLNDPASRNALSDGMVVELFEACLRTQADASLRAVVLTGAAGAFCAGGSLGGFASAIGQPLAEAEQSAFAVLPGGEPCNAVLDDDDRAIDDQSEVQCPEAHQVA